MTTRTRRKATLAGALALGGAALLGGATPASATAFITSCGYQITAPGTYVLTQDLNCPGGGIEVLANNARLVLGGHTITGPGSGRAASGIDAENVTGLSVRGGTITGFLTDIYVYESPGTRITGTTVTDAGRAGIALFNYCPGCEVIGSRATGNPIAIYIGAPDIRIVSNTLTNNSQGIYVNRGITGSILTGNRAVGNGTDLTDDNPGPGCVNTWRGNKFVTTGGLGAACIR